MSCSCGREDSPSGSRRDFLKNAGAGFGMLALTSLLKEQSLLAADTDPLAPRAPLE